MAGLAIHGLDDERVASVIERANIALDQARDRHQQIAVFDAEAYGDPAENLSLMGEMRQSVDVTYLDEALVPARYLVNGASIIQAEAVESVAQTLTAIEDEELRAALARLGAAIKRN